MKARNSQLNRYEEHRRSTGDDDPTTDEENEYKKLEVNGSKFENLAKELSRM